jgi:hypothetical protein
VFDMTESELEEEITALPFVPFRIHLVSGKTYDVLSPRVAWTLNHSLLVFRNPAPERSHAEGYDRIAYENIERLEQLEIGKRPTGKRKPA